MPKGYWIAHVTITDAGQYKTYQEIAPKAFQKYDAKFLARGSDAQTLEGDQWQRHVVIEFDSMEQALECYNSTEYKNARALRDGTCKASITIINGME
ncbi:DUF1330 domain-containing protein [Amylibacter sp. SFDW26]|uniref:DUF1330 domain-containing protein n=1 Tax=Amylibacter sp. SFDW26 TaxID=2652722 RepID=UPI001261C5F8|nr:DUF1330 domain-containing protein [Amylibacter sp. SFDW26]KAB7614397.1 DUF1330 domain-containing protein [Amylibacter sp. SFDW26]